MFNLSSVKESWNDENYFEALHKMAHYSAFGEWTKEKGCSGEALGYIPGMVTHTVSLIKDTISFGIHLIATIFLGFLALLACTKSESLNNLAKGALFLLLSSTSAIAIDAVGILCPPIAYRLNVEAYNAFSEMATLNNLD